MNLKIIMRDPKRIKRIVEKYAKVWETVPDWRFGQLLSNMHGCGQQDVFHTEDDDLEKGMDKWLKEENEQI